LAVVRPRNLDAITVFSGFLPQSHLERRLRIASATRLAMFTLNTAVSITIALLTPFWWGLGLLILACLGDVFPRLRLRVSRLFDWLERTHVESPNEPAISRTVAA
jgi:hypothetical protein